MTEEATVGGLGLGGLRDAIERRDPDLRLGFYAEDAQLRVLNGDTSEGSAFELGGRTEIGRYLRAVCDVDTICSFGEWDSSEERISFSETCEYPDGSRVVVKTTLELSSEGEILRQVDVVSPEETGAGGGDRKVHEEGQQVL